MRARLGGLLVLVLLASSVGVVPASSPTIVYAASFTVNDTADAIDADTNDGMCLTGTATCTLRAAIMQANASAGADIIVLPPGTYTLSLPGTNEDNC